MDKRPPILLEKTREVLRLKHYAQTTEESYTHWIKQLIRYSQPRHPSCRCASETRRYSRARAV